MGSLNFEESNALDISIAKLAAEAIINSFKQQQNQIHELEDSVVRLESRLSSLEQEKK